MKPPRPPAAPAFPRTALDVLLVVLGLVLTAIAVNGYYAFRFDHVSQIPLLYLQRDAGLFPRDWFFQEFAHFRLRFMHLTLINSLAWALGIPGALLALYILCLASTIGAWLAIARHLYGSILPGVVATLLAILFYGEIGSNHLIERILIPRAEAMALIYWGIYALIVGRPVLTGLVFGAAGCFQPATAVQFAIPMLIWAALTGGPQRGKQIALFLAALALVLVPWMAWLGRSFTGASNLTDAEIVHIVAWLRHPTLMLPRFFGRGAWAVFILVSAWAVLEARRMSRDNARVASVAAIVPIVFTLLLVSVPFIEFLPVKAVILFQPFRLSVLLYAFAFLLIAPSLVELLRSPEAHRRLRGVMLIASILVMKLWVPVVGFCLLAAALERRGQIAPRLEMAALVAMVALGGFFIEPHAGGGRTTWVLLGAALIAFLLLGAWHDSNAGRRPTRLRTGLATLAVLGFGMIALSFPLKLGAWIDNGRVNVARMAWRYQFNPVPIMPIEQLGAWARAYTPADALFLIPPGKDAPGFHLWSRRSAVFNVKFFPVTQAAYEEWRNRYLAHVGILEPESPESAEAVREALADVGLRKVDSRYAALTADRLLALADRYGADHVISPTTYDDPRLDLLRTGYERTQPSDLAGKLYLYRVADE